MLRAAPRDRTFRLIIVYKLAKGLAQLALAAILLLALWQGWIRAAAAHALASDLRAHALSHLWWQLVRLATGNHVQLVIAALAIDGCVTLVESWALHRGHAWGAWLVIAVTSALVPAEIVGLIHHAALGRALLLAINVLVVVVLVRRVVA
jgi:uncharacterized membrane protein (DUF2068 family)